MKANHLTALLTTLATAAALNSCVLQTDPVPEMPYRPRPVVITAPQAAETPEQTTTWETAPAPDNHITETLAERMPAGTAVEAKPAPALPEPPPEPKQEPATPSAPPAAAAPASITPLEITPFTPPTPAAAAPAATAAAATTATDLKLITNDGPIPTAARVEGDPTRVWNPLDPSKKIRIINPKTNQPYPSGKKLKVRGTNYQFYVP